MSEKLLTAVEAAEILKVKKNTVYDMIKRGDLKASKLGKQLRIREEDLETYIRYGSQKEIASVSQANPSKPGQVPARSRSNGNIILCGQDMILDLLADRLSRHPEGCPTLRSYKGSYNGLYALYLGQVDVATAHMWHYKTDSYNLPYINSMLPGTDVVVIHLLKRKQGFYVKKGNPKDIFTFDDLKRNDVSIVNREPGSGSRILMDEKLRQHHIPTAMVNGYHHVCNSHLEAAISVATGTADVALGTEKHSLQVEEIDFIFVQEESYDMIMRKEDFPKDNYQALLSIVRSPVYQNEVRALGGYDVTDMGKIIYQDEG
ncbi:MAG: helix-turn-helix transcriptional regulator [Clostridiales bacterium]|nr:helix-turn-helix transcriptional regulator [Clostridiales bacterium]